ncbi:hypothetical protein PSM_B0062 [Pseudoalteromonas sp. SM9913]|nr:hypothetical protein PSM_B0062 [Pseudoalteromonas sp. SM9913]
MLCPSCASIEYIWFAIFYQFKPYWASGSICYAVQKQLGINLNNTHMSLNK